jgi:hypothetical protein
VERASRRWRRRSARWRPGERTAAAAGAEQGNRRAQRKEMRGENGQGLICKNKKILGPLCKVKIPIDLKLK